MNARTESRRTVNRAHRARRPLQRLTVGVPFTGRVLRDVACERCAILGRFRTPRTQRPHRSAHRSQSRVKSIVVEDEPYLLQLVRYIHPRLMGFIEDGWQDVDPVLGRFATRVGDTLHAYRRFLLEGVGDGRRPHGAVAASGATWCERGRC